MEKDKISNKDIGRILNNLHGRLLNIEAIFNMKDSREDLDLDLDLDLILMNLDNNSK